MAANPNSCGARCLQELKQSAPAAHVFSVCAYFPNLDMGSELQAPRLYVKLAWLPPFRSPNLAAAQRRDALCRWDYCRQPAAENLRPWGRLDQKVSWHSSRVLALPGAFEGAAEGRKSPAVAPSLLLEDISHPPCTLGLVWASFLLLCYHHLAGEQLPPRMGVCFKTGEQLYRAGPAGWQAVPASGQGEDRARVLLL